MVPECSHLEGFCTTLFALSTIDKSDKVPNTRIFLRPRISPKHSHTQTIRNMSLCVACNKPLVVEIEADDDEQYEMAGSSSGKAPAAAPETVPDDVQLNCGCHFHW